MDGAGKEAYKPSEEYEEDLREPLVDISLNDSTELWLIQWPYKQNPDFDGKELSLELDGNGNLGSFEDASVGKISRRVSLVHYPEPKELEELNSLRQLYPTASGATLSNSSHRFSSPMQSSWRRNSQTTKTHSSYTHGSRHKSSLSEAGEPSKSPKRRHTNESNHSTDQSIQETGGCRSGVTFSGSLEHSHQGKSMKKIKYEE